MKSSADKGIHTSPRRWPRYESPSSSRRPEQESLSPAYRPRQEIPSESRRLQHKSVSPGRRTRDGRMCPSRRTRHGSVSPSRRTRHEGMRPTTRPRQESPCYRPRLEGPSVSRRPRFESLSPDRRPLQESPDRRPLQESPGRRPRLESPGRRLRQESPGRRPRQESPGRRPCQESPGRRPRQESPGRRPRQESPGRRPRQESPGRRPRQESPGRRPRHEDVTPRRIHYQSMSPGHRPRHSSQNKQRLDQQFLESARKVSADGRPEKDDIKKSKQVDQEKSSCVKEKEEQKIIKKVARKSFEPTVPPSDDGRYELDLVTSHALEAELQGLMDVVWKEMPTPESDAEKYIFENFKDAAGENIKNALGLNVTKRLLNIHNPLFVKLEFTSKPSPSALQRLAARFNVQSSAFRRARTPKSPNVFVVRLNALHDLDRVMRTRVMKCGKLKVTISTLYKYTKCPDKINTKYKIVTNNETIVDKQKLSDEVAKNVDDRDKSKPIVQVNDDPTKSIPLKPQQTKESALKLNATKEVKTSNDTVNKTTTVQNKAGVDGKKNNTPPKKAQQNATLTPQNITKNIKTTERKVAVKPVEAKPVSIKQVQVNPVGNIEEVAQTKASGSAAHRYQVGKPAPKTATEIVLASTVKATPSNSNLPAKKTEASTPKTTAGKSTQNIKPAEGKVTQNKNVKKVKPKNTKMQNDYDELDDKDILALLTGGIVLDEV